MIGALTGWLAASPTALRIGKWAAIAAMAALFILGVRRAGERMGRAVERLEGMEATNDAQRRMLEAGADRPRDNDDLARRMRDGRF